MKNDIKINYPLLQFKVLVDYDVIENLSSFEKLLFDVVGAGNFNQSEVQNMLPIDPRFVKFLMDKHVKDGLFEVEAKGSYKLTASGKANLLTLSLKNHRQAKVDVLYDPFLKLISSPKDFVFDQKFDYKIGLESMTDEQIMLSFPCNDLSNLIEDHADDTFMGSKFINKIEILDGDVQLRHVQLTIGVDFGEEHHYEATVFSQVKAYPLSIETLLKSGYGTILEIPSGLQDVLASIKEDQDSFYNKLLSKLEFSTDPELQKTLDEIKQDIFSYEMIVDKQHATALKQLIRMTEKEIFIASGWIKHRALANVESLLVEKLKNPNILVHLLYGFSKNDNKSSDGALEHLKKLQIIYPNLRLYDVHQEFHCKAIVVDGKVAAIGSHNWLSNTANSSKEWSMKIEDPKVAEDIKNKLFLPSIKMSKAA